MIQALAEVLLLASMVVNATLLIFIASVLQHVMNDMDAATFKDFVESLVRHSTRSPFMIIALNLPLSALFLIITSMDLETAGSAQDSRYGWQGGSYQNSSSFRFTEALRRPNAAMKSAWGNNAENCMQETYYRQR